MTKSTVTHRREKFLMAYANLPLGARKEIILVIDANGTKQPITWDVAYLEVKNNTPTGEKVLAQLEKLDLI